MGQNKVNERIAMAMLRQCALVWEYCTTLTRPMAKLEYSFAEVYKSIYGNTNCHNKAPIGHIDVEIDGCQYYELFTRRMREVDGTADYIREGRLTAVKMFFPTSDHEPQTGFGCSYPVEMVFEVARNFCENNGCSRLLTKTAFGMDSSGKYAVLPEVSVTRKLTKKTAAKAKEKDFETKPEPTLADRLREALLRQLKQAA